MLPHEETGQITVFGKGRKTRVIRLTLHVWPWPQFEPMLAQTRPFSAPRRVAGTWTRRRRCGSSGKPPFAPALILRYRPTGCAMLTPATRWTAARRSIWYKLLLGIPALRLQGDTYTLGRMKVRRGSWRFDLLRRRIMILRCDGINLCASGSSAFSLHSS